MTAELKDELPPPVEEGSVWAVAPVALVPGGGAALRHVACSGWHVRPQLCDVIEANVPNV